MKALKIFNIKHLAILGLSISCLTGLFLYQNQLQDKNIPSTLHSEIQQTKKEDKKEVLTNWSKYNWELGRALQYNLSYTAKTFDLNSSGALDATSNTFHLKGDLVVRVSSLENEIVFLSMQMVNASVFLDGTHLTNLENLLNQNIFVGCYSEHGRQVNLFFPQNLGNDEIFFLKQVFAVQIALPDNRTKHWNLTEADGIGEYHAKYHLGTADTITKTKINYLPDSAGVKPAEIISSQTDAHIGEIWLKDYHLTEVLEITLSGQSLLKSQNEIDLVVKNGPIDESLAIMRLPVGLTANELLQYITTAVNQSNSGSLEEDLRKSRKEKLRQEFENVPFENMLSELEQSIQAAQNHDETIPAILRLRDWLTVNPQEAHRIKSKLEDDNIPGELSGRLIHALELASDLPEAQEALAEIIVSEEIEEGVQLQAIVASTGLEIDESSPIVNSLQDVAFNVTEGQEMTNSDSALLVLGSIAGKNEVVAQKLKDQIVGFIENPNEVHPQDLTISLNTLENANVDEPAYIEMAQNLAQKHEDEHVRAAALSFSDTDRQGENPLLLKALNDPSVEVKRASLALLDERETLSEEAASGLITQLNVPDETEFIQTEVATLLGKHMEQNPRIRTALEEKTLNSSENLKGVIQDILSGENEIINDTSLPIDNSEAAEISIDDTF